MVEAGDVAVGALVGLMGFLGLLMASGALDEEIYVFGLSLAGFATLFIFGLVKRHFDRVDGARHV
jgi:hypothetical protein